MPPLDDPWEELRDINTLSGYPNVIKQNPTIFIPLMYRALLEIERFKDRHPQEQELRRFPNPINNVPNGYLNEVYRRILSKGVRNEIFPRNFMSTLVKKSIELIMFFVELAEPMDGQIVVDIIASHLAKIFDRRDYDWQVLDIDGERVVPFVISAEDQVLIMGEIVNVSNQIRTETFQPVMRFGTAGAKMSSLVPHHSFMRRHIPISRDTFQSLLLHSGYANVPTCLEFRNDDELAALWFWSVLDFTRMGFDSLEEFRGVRRCFDFKLYSDGFAVTAQFTRPLYLPGAAIRPQDVGVFDRDETFYVDPGRSQCFTAMKGISNPNNPTLIMKLSNGEYKHMASIKLVERARHGLKVENFAPLVLLPEFKVQLIESNMPSKKTMHQDRFLEYMEYVRDHCLLLTDFYDQRFNKFKFWGYCGRQRALSEVS